MARKNTNAGQPNRTAQVERRKKVRVHLESHADFRRSGTRRTHKDYEQSNRDGATAYNNFRVATVDSDGPSRATDLRYDRVVLGPLSEHLTPSKKPHGELVERVHFEVFA